MDRVNIKIQHNQSLEMINFKKKVAPAIKKYL